MARQQATDSVSTHSSVIGHKLTFADVDSKNGSLFCQMCNDYVYDPTLEELRIRKYGTGSLSGMLGPFMRHTVISYPTVREPKADSIAQPGNESTTSSLQTA